MKARADHIDQLEDLLHPVSGVANFDLPVVRAESRCVTLSTASMHEDIQRASGQSVRAAAIPPARRKIGSTALISAWRVGERLRFVEASVPGAPFAGALCVTTKRELLKPPLPPLVTVIACGVGSAAATWSSCAAPG